MNKTNSSPDEALELDSITLPLKASIDDEPSERNQSVPVLAPHTLTVWLLQAGLLKFDAERAMEFWRHHRAVGMPWIREDEDFSTDLKSSRFEPAALYGDEAEYTNTKEKVFMLFLSHSSNVLSTHVLFGLVRFIRVLQCSRDEPEATP